jgi:hypothetical protein
MNFQILSSEGLKSMVSEITLIFVKEQELNQVNFFYLKITEMTSTTSKNVWFICICVLQAIISYIVSLCSQLNSNYLLDCKHGQ